MNLKKQIKLPTTVVTFLKLHISDLLGAVSIFRAKVNKFTVDHQFSNDTNDREHEKWFENWKGLGKTTKHNDWKFDDEYLAKTENDQNEDSDTVPVNIEKEDSNCDISFNTHDHDYCNKLEYVENLSHAADRKNKSSSPTTNTKIENVNLEKKNRDEIDRENVVDLATHSSVTLSNDNYLPESIRKIHEEKSNNKKDTKYFQNFSEIKLVNNLVNTKAKKIFLLINGNNSGIVQSNGKKWLVYNTCPFDTIIQLLFYGALENVNFDDFITQSDYPIFKFLTDFMKDGPTKSIYCKRLSILNPIYNKTSVSESHETLDKESHEIQLCQIINCKDNITNLWKILFESMPSIFEKTVCSNPHCQEYTTSFPALTVNHKIIAKNGFTALEKALNFHEKIFNIPCQFCGSGKRTRTNIPQKYLFIELDIRGSLTERSGRICKLREFPTVLNLKTQSEDATEINLCYRLSGVAAYDTGHYFAYCRKFTGTWSIFNDIVSKPRIVSPNDKLEPHGVFYVLEQ